MVGRKKHIVVFPNIGNRPLLPKPQPIDNPPQVLATKSLIVKFRFGPGPIGSFSTSGPAAEFKLHRPIDSGSNLMDSSNFQGAGSNNLNSSSLSEISLSNGTPIVEQYGTTGGADLNLSSGASKRCAPATTNVAKKRVKKDPWAADNVVEDHNSPLVKADIRALLADPEAWEALSRAERAEIIALMPEHDAVLRDGDKNASISSDFLRYNQDWSHSVTNYREDLAEGRNDPEWQLQAITASQQRAAGQFDNFKEAEFEEFWGQKMKPPPEDLDATSSRVKFAELFYSKILQVGDVFRYSRHLTPTVILQKEAKILDIKPPFADISFAPGRDVIWTPRADNIVLTRIGGPELLVKAICDAFGCPDMGNSTNGWKALRVFRGQHDLGSAWDLRQAFGFARTEGDYLTSLTGQPNRARRLSDVQLKCGYCWIHKLYLVKKTLISDLPAIPQAHIIPIANDLAQALTNLAPPNYTFILSDTRVVGPGGICLPEGVSMEEVLEKGPEVFPTAWTKSVAGAYGPHWSGGHAQIGCKQLGSLPLAGVNLQDPQNLVTKHEKKCLETLLGTAATATLPEALVRIYNMRPLIVPSINPNNERFVRPMASMPKILDPNSCAEKHSSSQHPSDHFTALASQCGNNQPNSSTNLDLPSNSQRDKLTAPEALLPYTAFDFPSQYPNPESLGQYSVDPQAYVHQEEYSQYPDPSSFDSYNPEDSMLQEYAPQEANPQSQAYSQYPNCPDDSYHASEPVSHELTSQDASLNVDPVLAYEASDMEAAYSNALQALF